MHTDLRRTTRWAALALVAASLPVLAGAGPGASATPAEPTPDLLSTTGGGSLDVDLIEGLDVRDDLTFNVAPGTDIVGTLDDHTTHDAYDSWTGSLADGGFFTLVRAGSALRVHVASSSGTYDITQGKGTSAKVDEVVVDDAVEADHGSDARVPPTSPDRARRSAGAPPVAGDSGAVVDMLIAFTPQAAAELGGVPQAVATAGTVVEQTNIIFANSQIPTRVRLVASAITVQNQLSTVLDTELDALTSKVDGVYDELHTLREQYHADQVSLMGSSATGQACGLGWLGGAENYAFTATEVRCLDNYTVTHELGHNLAADHDRYPGVTNAGRTPDAAGLVNPAAGWNTIMGYYNACTAAGVYCTRIPYFSNPAVLYNGAPTGTPTANNARVITAYAPTVANFRQEQITPGALSYSGYARHKSTLSVATTAWSPSNVAVGYQWYLDGQPIAGATGTTLTSRASYIGHTLSVGVTGSAPYYPAVGVSSAPVTVAKAQFRTKRPVLKGTPRVGRVLKVKLKKIKPKKKVKIRYTWYRDGKRIKGAKGRTYRVRRQDRKDKISCVVKLKKKNYQTAKLKTRKRKIKR